MTPPAKAGEEGLVVVEVAALVGVDEGEVERVPRGREGVQRRGEPKADAVGDPGLHRSSRGRGRPSSLTSQQTKLPPGATHAIAMEDQPVNVPTSRTRFAFVIVTRKERKAPSTVPTIIWGAVCVALVSSPRRSKRSARAVV